MAMVVRIIYDNEALIGTPGHGFSCLIEKDGNGLLFDTGWDGSIFMENGAKLGLELMSIKRIFISHSHWDHMGGLSTLLPPGKSDKELYFPTATKKMRGELEKRAKLVDCQEPTKIFDGVFTTGVMGRGVREHSLVIKERDGAIVVTGCAHQGIEVILKRAKEIGGKKISALIGGFHDFDGLNLLEGIGTIAPCHCTVRKEEIKKLFPKSHVPCGVGTIIEL